MIFIAPALLTLQKCHLDLKCLRTAIDLPVAMFTCDSTRPPFDQRVARSLKCLDRHIAPEDATVAYVMREFLQTPLHQRLIATIENWQRYLNDCNRAPLFFDSVIAKGIDGTVRLFLDDLERLVNALGVRIRLMPSRR